MLLQFLRAASPRRCKAVGLSSTVSAVLNKSPLNQGISAAPNIPPWAIRANRSPIARLKAVGSRYSRLTRSVKSWSGNRPVSSA